ncbi:MAG: ketoacyl-ACP synthase III [Bacteroidota bacterium]
MYINSVTHYLPEGRVPNSHFNQINGLTEEWIISRTGIKERTKAGPLENTHTMGIAAVEKAIEALPYTASEIDLIVGATYTGYDNIVTLGHALQHYLQADDAVVLSLSSACSSLLNAIEVVEGYFAMGKADTALVVASDHNTAYSDETDRIAGHLWGDGAVAFFISKERTSPQDHNIIDLFTKGAAHVGKATEGVVLRPAHDGFVMNHGKDVFIHACQYMTEATQKILADNSIPIEEMAYFIPHQANWRITRKVLENLGLPEEKGLSNIQYLGNTGCPGCGIAFSEHQEEFKQGEYIVMTVFGGGYSYGAMLIEV